MSEHDLQQSEEDVMAAAEAIMAKFKQPAQQPSLSHDELEKLLEESRVDSSDS